LRAVGRAQPREVILPVHPQRSPARHGPPSRFVSWRGSIVYGELTASWYNVRNAARASTHPRARRDARRRRGRGAYPRRSGSLELAGTRRPPAVRRVGPPPRITPLLFRACASAAVSRRGSPVRPPLRSRLEILRA